MARVCWTNQWAELRKNQNRHSIENFFMSKLRYQSEPIPIVGQYYVKAWDQTKYNHNCHKLQHSQRTVMLTNLVTGLPTPFSAVHLYIPLSWLPRMVKGKFTWLLSATFVQVIFGAGLPSAIQNKLTTSPLFTICSAEMFVILGVSLKGTNHQKVIRY